MPKIWYLHVHSQSLDLFGELKVHYFCTPHEGCESPTSDVKDYLKDVSLKHSGERIWGYTNWTLLGKMVKKLLKVEYLATNPQKSALQPSVPVPSTKTIASAEPYQSWAPQHQDQRMAPAFPLSHSSCWLESMLGEILISPADINASLQNVKSCTLPAVQI